MASGSQGDPIDLAEDDDTPAPAARTEPRSQRIGQLKRGDDDDDEEDSTTPATKRLRTNGSTPSLESPIKLFATSATPPASPLSSNNQHSIPPKYCWSLRQFLGLDKGPIAWLVVATYLIDFDFVLDELPELVSIPRTTVIYGGADNSQEPWKRACTQLDGSCTVDFVIRNPAGDPGSNTNPRPERIPYGVHHAKFFLVGYASGTLRVVIHTSNLRHADVHLKTQGAYVQDFQRKTAKTTSPSAFEETLLSYLDTYQLNQRHVWEPNATPRTLVEQLKLYDFSTATAVLIPSVPGYHVSPTAFQWGHAKLRDTIAKYTHLSSSEQQGRPIVLQFSSIGSLSLPYLNKLLQSMDVQLARAATTLLKKDDQVMSQLKLVYPTVEEIRSSVEGYRGGASVPGSSKNVSKDCLKGLFHKWSPDNPYGHTVPHIKTYYQMSETDESLAWFVLSSHNLSKAAWGEWQSKGKRFLVRHWELGVFMAPQLVGGRRLVVAPTDNPNDEIYIPIAHKVCPTPYGPNDQPWAVDRRYNRPDEMGRFGTQDPRVGISS